ncbi:carboxymuconolactone decarboxylase family protein [Jidongwangia harbinensis]|uniref:carboxymuconolactone decarboxylase family protein n=1 Tax=Jidongwangia harbinensis TaxID=2878561 RepID=UPI001CD9F38D|nr:carboxymuconolactone decarboxylase family protein [Jidongwangia harbinensis]MCA2217194.1 carboxymuconolactone decarboxylase family protein [Jidongwangia harbinensis]
MTRPQAWPRIPPLGVEAFLGTPTGRAYAEIAAQAFEGLLADRPPPNVLRTLAHHRELFPAMMPLLAHVAGEVLPARDREIAILRTAWRSQAPYIWAHHHPAGLAAGLSNADIARIASEEPGGWAPFESALLRAVDELHAGSVISADTWRSIAGRYHRDQALELMVLAGTYRTLAYVLNSCQVPIDTWLPRPAPLPPGPAHAARFESDWSGWFRASSGSA